MDTENHTGKPLEDGHAAERGNVAGEEKRRRTKLKEQQDKYRRKIRRFTFQLSLHDWEVREWFERQPNKGAYLKRLIYADKYREFYGLKKGPVPLDGGREKRMAGDFVIIHALKIGDREIVLGEDPDGMDDERYMCAFCEGNGPQASYTEAIVDGDYSELVKLFGARVAEQAEKTRIALVGPKLQGIPDAPITAEGCEVIGGRHDLRGKVVVIKPEVLRPEYRRATCQLHLCNGGIGAYPDNLGSVCFCTELYSGMASRFERDDILGIIEPGKLPKWAKHYLEILKAEGTSKSKEKEDR